MEKICRVRALTNAFLAIIIITLTSCGSAKDSGIAVSAQSPSNATSVIPNEIAAGIVGETLSLSQNPVGSSSNAIPFSNCTQVNPSMIALTQASNESAFGGPFWLGTLEYTSSVMTCGIPVSATFIRQYVTAPGGRPGNGRWKSASGETMTIDDATGNLGNYRNDLIFPLVNGGYGRKVVFVGQARTEFDLAERVVEKGAFDLSVAGSLKIDSSRDDRETLSGTMGVYHNQKKTLETLNFDHVSYQNGCCLPVSGKIVASDQTLQFIGCEKAILRDANGISVPITLSHCL